MQSGRISGTSGACSICFCRSRFERFTTKLGGIFHLVAGVRSVPVSILQNIGITVRDADGKDIMVALIFLGLLIVHSIYAVGDLCALLIGSGWVIAVQLDRRAYQRGGI